MCLNRNKKGDWQHDRYRGWRIKHSKTARKRGIKPVYLAVLTAVWSTSAFASYGAGSGTPENPYLIFTAQHLAQISNNPEDWDKHFKLMADIDMRDYNGVGENESFEPIGYLQWQPYESKPFKGTFDGNGKRIINLRISSTARDFVGLFGYVQASGECIKNVTLVNPTVDAATAMYVGAIAGKLRSGSIAGCAVEGGSISGGDCTGGLVGYNSQATISNCNLRTAVSGNTNVGGIAGYHHGGTIWRCGFTGRVTGLHDVGGLAGESDGDIIYCCADGNVTAQQDKAAGLVGTLRGHIYGSYAKCRVDGDKEIGGLVGRDIGQIQDSYTHTTVAGDCYVGAITGLLYGGGTVTRCYAVYNIEAGEGPRTLAGWEGPDAVSSASFCTTGEFPDTEMMMQTTYTDAGWDFLGENANGSAELWEICEGTDFPRLSWQKVPSVDWGCPDGVDIYDLAILFAHWLTNKPSVDITGAHGDGFVNFEDLAVIAAAWKTSPGLQGWNASCDIWPTGGDGIVDTADLAVLTQNWLLGVSTPADLSHTGPDGRADLLDWATFAAAWQSTNGSANWDAGCDIAPDGGNNIIDKDDIIVFIDAWLTTGAGPGDIAPENGGDGFVNLLDFALAAKYYRPLNR